jgi:hypothetical protein
MDPLTALSLAGNILTFIDFSYKVISGANKVLSTSNGMTPENERLGVLVEDLNVVTQDLVADIPARTETKAALCLGCKLSCIVRRALSDPSTFESRR